jgi:cellulose 1,4-beta-cellobiosidase
MGAAGTGAAGTGGKAGTGGAGNGAAGTGAGCGNCMLKVEYQCKQDGPNVGTAVFSVRITNTGTTAVQLNTVTVRYWYTIDGTGAQSGTCNSTAHPCTVAFQTLTPAKNNANESAVISFGNGTLAAGANTGDVDVTMSGGSGTYTQTNDYSFASTGAQYINRDQIAVYASGQLKDGTPP